MTIKKVRQLAKDEAWIEVTVTRCAGYFAGSMQVRNYKEWRYFEMAISETW